MSPLPLSDLLAAHPAQSRWSAHFCELARALLQDCELTIAGRPHRICELEFYLHTPDHPDPFTHRAPAQALSGRWYFHRSGESYRGGSFKGLDINFGPAESHGGVLIRSLREDTGRLINGSSLCVDHMLAVTESTSVAELDASVAGLSVDDPRSPLALVPRAPLSAAEPAPWTTARVGLSLKRAAEHPTMLAYIARRYRFLTAPAAIKKGRVQLILALHEDGASAEEIRKLTRSPAPTIERYIAAYARGRSKRDAAPFIGRGLDPLAVSELFGALRGCE